MKILALAGTTLREVLRRKVQVNLLLFGVVLISSSWIISELTVGQMRRIVTDLGLTAMELIGTLLAVFLGAGLVAGDVERRVIYPIIAKPISRATYLIGRYAGLVVALVLNLALMAGVLSLALWLANDSPRPLFTPSLFAAFGAMGAQFAVVAAVAVFFSAVSSQTLASIFALSVALAGHFANDVRALTGVGAVVPRFLWYCLPNLQALSLNAQVLYDVPPSASLGLALLYAAGYAGMTLALASFLFERRDFQ